MSSQIYKKFKNIKKCKLDKIFLNAFYSIERRYKGSLEKTSIVDEIYLLLFNQTPNSLEKVSKLLDELNYKNSKADILLYAYILLKYNTKKVMNNPIVKQKMRNVILNIEKLLNKIANLDRIILI
jgi:hypothetical protein